MEETLILYNRFYIPSAYGPKQAQHSHAAKIWERALTSVLKWSLELDIGKLHVTCLIWVAWNMHLLLFQYQKQGKDVEKVKQRLAEIANYVDKVNQSYMPTQHIAVMRSLRLKGFYTATHLFIYFF